MAVRTRRSRQLMAVRSMAVCWPTQGSIAAFDPVASKSQDSATAQGVADLAIGRELARTCGFLSVRMSAWCLRWRCRSDWADSEELIRIAILPRSLSGCMTTAAKYAYTNLPAAQKFLGLDEVTGRRRTAKPGRDGVGDGELR